MARRSIAVYIMANSRRTLYIGVTNDLFRRVSEHKSGQTEGYTNRYNLTKLVYYEIFDSMRGAIAREKQSKGWLRARKISLVEASNPFWHDLAIEWYARVPSLRSG
jgi:putative endonuclease